MMMKTQKWPTSDLEYGKESYANVKKYETKIHAIFLFSFHKILHVKWNAPVFDHRAQCTY